MRVPVELRRSYRLLNHGPTTLVTSAAHGARDVMAAAWAMPLDYDPPKVAVVIAADTYTRELVEASGAFVLNLPTRAQADVTLAAGSRTGRGRDKLAELGLATAPASLVEAPLVEGCAAWLECRVIPEPKLARELDLFVAEVVAAWADDASFVDGAWRFPDDAHRTIHHLSRGVFFATGERFEATAQPMPPQRSKE